MDNPKIEVMPYPDLVAWLWTREFDVCWLNLSSSHSLPLTASISFEERVICVSQYILKFTWEWVYGMLFTAYRKRELVVVNFMLPLSCY